MSKDMKEAAKQYAEIEMKKVLNVRATAERSFIAGAEWQENQSQWINPKEFPPMDEPILLVYGDGGIYDYDLGYYTGLHYINKEGQQVDEHVIAWMPIPKFNE